MNPDTPTPSEVERLKEALSEALARVEKYRARLEIDYVYEMRDGDMVRVKADHDDTPDGIECRDETIRLIQERADAAEARASVAEKALEEAAAIIASLTAERDEAEKDAHELTKALTGLVGGGSEMFIRKRERFLADIPYCIQRLRERSETAHRHVVNETLRAKAAEAERYEAIKGEFEREAYRRGWNDREADFLAGVARIAPPPAESGGSDRSAEARASAAEKALEEAERVIANLHTTAPTEAALDAAASFLSEALTAQRDERALSWGEDVATLFGLLDRAADGGYTLERTKGICASARQMISRLSTEKAAAEARASVAEKALEEAMDEMLVQWSLHGEPGVLAAYHIIDGTLSRSRVEGGEDTTSRAESAAGRAVARLPRQDGVKLEGGE